MRIQTLSLVITAVATVAAAGLAAPVSAAPAEVFLSAPDDRGARQKQKQKRRAGQPRQQRGAKNRNGDRRARGQQQSDGERKRSRRTEVENDPEAGTRDRETTWTGPDGRERKARHETQRTEDGHTRSSTWTDADGQSATREAVVTRDSEAGTVDREVQFTGRDGREGSASHNTTRTDKGFDRSSTWTGADGQTVSRDASFTRDAEAGTVNRDVTVTGPDGRQHTGSHTLNRTDDGFTQSSTWTNADGETVTRDNVIRRDAETGTLARDMTLTGPDGRTLTGNHEVSRTDKGFDRNSTWTNDEGQSVSRDAQVAIDREAGVIQRDVTVTDEDGVRRTVADEGRRTEDGRARTTTFTDADGNTVTREADVYWDPETETWIREVEVDDSRN